MLFSLDRHSKEKKLADEIRCEYNQLALLLPFIQQYPNKRYVVTKVSKECSYTTIAEQIKLLLDLTTNYTIQCTDIPSLRRMLHDGYNAFIKYPVNDWETFTDLIELGVSDICVDGTVAFSADKIKSAKNTTKIRVSPTYSINSAFSPERVSSFFIRPSDLYLYEDIIDVIDFLETDHQRETTLFDIYKNKGSLLLLGDYITNAPKDISDFAIDDEFAKRRLNCGQSCRIPGRTCHYCQISLWHAKMVSAMLKDRKEFDF